MNEAPRAVFLSYASQDAGAAKRICDALRAAGVEVWFDQSELRGGDAWDQKIRRQIKECALFVPLISANTQARPEGYFRLEWHLAEQRSLLIAKGRPFLVPVTVDETSDRDALVPDAFLAVQWMRAPAGECSATFVADVMRLLAGGDAPRAPRPMPVASATPPSPAAPAPRASNTRKLVPLAVVAAAAVVAVAIWRPWRNSAAAKPTTTAAPVVATSPEIAALRARIVPDRWQKGDFEAVNATLDRLLQQNPEDADAWALRGIICSLQTMRLIDRGTKPLQDGRAAAERALRIAPDSPLANLALGYHLTANINRGGDPEAGRAPMERAVAALPPDAITRYGALATVWNAYDIEATERRAREWLEAEPTATFPAWIMASMSNIARRPDDVVKWGERVTGDPNITGVRAFSTMFDAHYYLRADLASAASVLDRVPPRGRTVARIIFCRWLLHSAQGRHDDALQALAAVPDPFIGDVSFAGPKALLAGFSHRWAGRTEAAAVQLREAERLLRDRLATDAENEEFRIGLALALALLGREADARTELALVEPVLRGRAPSLYRGQLFSFVTQVYASLGDGAAAAYYLRRIFTEPSNPPHTPASLRQDPRFMPIIAQPEIKSLLKEFAHLDVASAKTSGVSEKSVAVLAFANLSDEKANEYFSDGISEELLNVLAKVPGLKVSARTSAFHFKGKDTPIAEIARQLGVAYVVEGSVRKAGDKVRITAQLIKASDGFHVWSDTFTRDLRDIFAVQDEIAALIAQSLQIKLGDAPRPAKQVNPAAFNLFLEARQYVATVSVANLTKAEMLYLKALEIDPEFTRAAAGLAVLRITRALNRCVPSRFMEPELAEIERATRDILRRDPNLGEAHAALGLVLAGRGQNAEAAAAFAAAGRLGFNREQASHILAFSLFRSGRPDLAITAMEEARQVNPLAWTPIDVGGLGYLFTRRYAEAAERFRAAARTNGAPVTFSNLALALIGLGRNEEAIAAARQAVAVPNRADWQPGFLAWSDGLAAWALAQAGARSEAEAIVSRLLAGPEESRYAANYALIVLGRFDEAAPTLEDQGGNHGYLFYFLNERPALLADARVAQLLTKLHAEEDFATFRRVVAEQEAKK
jgi:TolB-like protein/Flp pilus assembly protein TadD